MKRVMTNEVIRGEEKETMRIGTMVRIKTRNSLPKVVAQFGKEADLERRLYEENRTYLPEEAFEFGEVVDLQMQPYEEYRAYPVWVRMLSGKRKGKVCGFNYDEVEVWPKSGPKKNTKKKIVEQLEEILEEITAKEEKMAGKVMRVGGIINIRRSDAVTGAVGETAEIVDLQVQPYDKYRVYPVWAKMLSGEYKGKVYGFQCDEVEALPQVVHEQATKIKILEQLEECLKAIKIGGAVRIRRCDSLPEVVGEFGNIVDMQIQEFDKYRVYPVWVKVVSGTCKGKVYGFQYDELEVMPTVWPQRATKVKVWQQLEERLGSINTLEEVAEIERSITEARGKILVEETVGFWEDKTPCWEKLHCPVRNECPAFKNQCVPCWEIHGVYSHGGDVCHVCRVYKRWSHVEPIEVKLRPKEINHATQVVVEKPKDRLDEAAHIEN